MILINNERKIAEDLLNRKEIKMSQGKQLYILSKYYLETLDKTQFNTDIKLKNEVKRLLHDFLRSKSRDNYIWEMKESFIKKIIKNSFDIKLIKVESVDIYKEEIDIIRQLRDVNKEKILFSMLIESKLQSKIRNSNAYWSNLQTNELGKLANIKKSKVIREKYINDFVKIGAIRLTNRIDRVDRELLFVGGFNIVITITDFEDFGLQYEKYILCNENIIECEECGRLIVRNGFGRPKIYCDDCSKKIELKKTNERVQKVLEKSKING